MGGWNGWAGGRVSDYNATSWPPTDQLKLNGGQLSWSVGAECGNILEFETYYIRFWIIFYIVWGWRGGSEVGGGPF